MAKLTFQVQGSAAEPYQVDFYKEGDNLTAFCTCRAGQVRQYCKHRINLLNGITKGLVSDNADQVETLRAWIPGSQLEAALALVEYEEAQYNQAHKELYADYKAADDKLKAGLLSAKKQLAKIMHG